MGFRSVGCAVCWLDLLYGALFDVCGQPVCGSSDAGCHAWKVVPQLRIEVDCHLVTDDPSSVHQQQLERLGGAVDATPQRIGRHASHCVLSLGERAVERVTRNKSWRRREEWDTDALVSGMKWCESEQPGGV